MYPSRSPYFALYAATVGQSIPAPFIPLAGAASMDDLSRLVHALIDRMDEDLARKISRNPITATEVQEKLRISASQLHAMTNPKDKAYIPNFARKWYIGKSRRWWEDEVDEWLAQEASATRSSH